MDEHPFGPIDPSEAVEIPDFDPCAGYTPRGRYVRGVTGGWHRVDTLAKQLQRVMPKISEMRESKFLKQTDVGRGVLATVEGCVQMNVAKEGADPEMKWCLTFVDVDKPLVINSTNAQLCAKIFQSDDTDDWHGKRVVLYADPNVSFQGKLVGGIRVRAPKPSAVAPVVAKPEPTDDDYPF